MLKENFEEKKFYFIRALFVVCRHAKFKYWKLSKVHFILERGTFFKSKLKQFFLIHENMIENSYQLKF